MPRLSTWALILALQSTTTGATVLEPTEDMRGEPSPGLDGITTLAARYGAVDIEAFLLANGLVHDEVSITPLDVQTSAIEADDNIAVPIPPAAWLFGAAILAFAGLSTRHSR